MTEAEILRLIDTRARDMVQEILTLIQKDAASRHGSTVVDDQALLGILREWHPQVRNVLLRQYQACKSGPWFQVPR